MNSAKTIKADGIIPIIRYGKKAWMTLDDQKSYPCAIPGTSNLPTISPAKWEAEVRNLPVGTFFFNNIS